MTSLTLLSFSLLISVVVPIKPIDRNSTDLVSRLSPQPILSPRQGHFDCAGAYNPAALKDNGRFVLIYRGQNKEGTSFLGLAESQDGVTFKQSEKPLLSPETDYEKDGGLEDPRVVKIGDTYYLTYTGYNKKDAQLCLATSTNLKEWKRHGVIMPAYKGAWNKGWTKSGAIITEKINGKFWMYYLGTADSADQMGVACSDDLINWRDALDRPVLPKRPGMFDSKVIEPGPPPLVTDKGILLLYNGADDKFVYRLGWVLFDRKDPARIVARCEEPVFAPEKEWELQGQVPNVVFVEGLIKEGNRLILYYGGADSVTGVAQTQLTSDTE